MNDNIPTGGYFEDMLSEEVEGSDLDKIGQHAGLSREPEPEDTGWKDRWANRWAELSELADRVPLPPVRTEPILYDPRPVRVRLHGRAYYLHRVVYGQVLGCGLVDAQPGTVVPAALFPPTGGLTSDSWPRSITSMALPEYGKRKDSSR